MFDFDVEVPEFFIPSLDSMRECQAILPAKEANGIFNAAMFANANCHTAAEKHRRAAGYGGLGKER